MKYQYEQTLVEISTGKEFYILGTPQNCQKWKNNNPVYLVSSGNGMIQVIDQEELESNQFVLKKA